MGLKKILNLFTGNKGWPEAPQKKEMEKILKLSKNINFFFGLFLSKALLKISHPN